MTDRAVSTLVGYILMVGVAAVLLTGLTLAATGLVDTQDERTTHAELDVYGERLAADIMTADRLAHQGSETTVTVTSELPATVNGHQYTITFEGNGDATTIILRSDDFDRTTETGVVTSASIVTDDREVRGGTITISYDSGEDELVISND